MSGTLISFLASTLTGGGAVPQAVSNANPLPVTLSGGIGGLEVAGTIPDGAPAGAQFPVTVGGVDQATGNVQTFSVDATGVLNVNAVLAGGGIVGQGAGNTANPWTVQGPAASATASSGNPVKVGGVFVTTPPSLSTGQVGDLLLDSTSNLRSRWVAGTVTAGDTISNNVITSPVNINTASQVLNPVATAAYIFNGSSWDRGAKPRTAFRLPSSAATNNAANIKASPGTVYSISANITLAASTCYLKFFDTTAAPNPAALTPLYMFALNIVNGAVSFNLPAGGLYFPTGIGVAIVANPADLDNTAIAAGQVTALNVSFL